MAAQTPNVVQLQPATEIFLADVTEGLAGDPRQLPSKYFYDERGSQLFGQICNLDEYYLTRTELAIMKAHAPEMAEQIGPGVMLVEYGSGTSEKTRLLRSASRLCPGGHLTGASPPVGGAIGPEIPSHRSAARLRRFYGRFPIAVAEPTSKSHGRLFSRLDDREL